MADWWHQVDCWSSEVIALVATAAAAAAGHRIVCSRHTDSLILGPRGSPNFDSWSLYGTHRILKKNLGRHSRSGAERCNSRWPLHPYTQYNSIWICPGVMNLVSLPTFWGSRNPLKSWQSPMGPLHGSKVKIRGHMTAHRIPWAPGIATSCV